MPLFSVVIPTYNRSSSISKSLDSIIAQKHKEWECLVVDDSSTDNTKEIIEDYCKKDLRFHYLVNERNKGASGARNTGIIHAKGEYISFLDSDDIWHPDCLQKQLGKYQNNEKVGCVYSNLINIMSDGGKIPFGAPLGIEGDVYPSILKQGYLAPTSALSAKKKNLIEVGLFDEALPASQDDDLCFKLAKTTVVSYIPEIMVYMYIDSKDRISGSIEKVSMGWWLLWNKYESDVLNYCGINVMAKHYKECLNHFIQAGNAKMSWKAYKKYSQFGGFISIRQKIWLMAYCLSNGYSEYINQKIKSKL